MSRKTKKNRTRVTPTYSFGDFKTQMEMLAGYFRQVEAMALAKIKTNDDLTEEEQTDAIKKVQSNNRTQYENALYKCARRIDSFYGTNNKYLANGQLREG